MCTYGVNPVVLYGVHYFTACYIDTLTPLSIDIETALVSATRPNQSNFDHTADGDNRYLILPRRISTPVLFHASGPMLTQACIDIAPQHGVSIIAPFPVDKLLDHKQKVLPQVEVVS